MPPHGGDVRSEREGAQKRQAVTREAEVDTSFDYLVGELSCPT